MPPKRTTVTTTPITDAQNKALISQGVADALAERNTNRSRNDDDSHDSGGDERRQMPVARECTYTDFLKWQPLNFKGTEGVNSHVRTVGHDVAYGMPGKTFKKMMTDKYCPRSKIKKLEIKMWNLKGHFKSNCPKLKNRNQGNQARNGNVVARAYVVGNAGKNPDANVMTGTFLLNNRYASILFDTGADRSFVSTAFSSLIDIVPSTLDHDYDIELADEKIIRVNTIIQGCTLNFLNHPFSIDLMSVELGSFDIIISMDWLSMYHVVIVCAEKIVHIP
ncbi:putative reverse transcriptase domain-containing protein [Tanacetum coccineum]